ncbi:MULTISPECIES: bile acid:sodium symporter family protein [unclassified Ruegeria]|uniref:bile acid:sodium symporter family protein n=1 Tax=unclassified Ruegeria TaxID=2625375 RepID=UPI00148851DD|nr:MULTISPECIES: bile acid:sodium symporter family protein [unclassified Ruegeria]NOD74658.1 bile acid:sodium symporter family protein [Ruegeria sp. HKCCD4332]NOD88608.1 bile acid:sodium symporter family protein [Ruegeria sp. HKCCD4318]NOE12164.1 bile acid:sodium symporter family protein [Ruegeria sp. HKCCD4318-2]NOG09671.1 bile acid:sodium symporter family protein [Ruegeria sp. HKCCD4315]
MDLLINVGLPISLAIIMLSLGIGLETADFRRVLSRKYPFAIGAVCQVVLLPIAAFLTVTLFGLPPEIAVGFMLLSFCPGGVTSNILTKLAKGDVALSVSLTAVISILSILTVPFLAAWSITYFMGENAPDVSISGLAIAMFLITTLPVAIGVIVRRFATGFANRIENGLSTLATALFVLIVVAALAGNWQIFIDNLGIMGTGLISLNVALLLIGLGIARAANLSWAECKSISIDTGIQNSTLGITLAALITGTESGFSPLALPSAVYGITMYAVVLPFLVWFRRR